MARKTKEDSDKTRESLLNAAEVVFLRRGVSRSTLEDIAKEAGVTRGAIYWHFDNKIDLLRAVHDRVKTPLDLLFAELTGGDDPVQGLKTIALHVFDKMENDTHARNVFTIMRLRCEDFLCDGSPEAQEIWAKRQDVYQRFTNVFSQIEKKQPLAHGMTPELAAIAFHAFISGVFWDFLTARGPYPLTKLGPVLVEGFFHGVFKVENS